MSGLLPAILLTPLVTALGALATQRRATLSRVVSFAGAVTLLGLAVRLLVETLGGTIVVSQIGDWSAPFGITLVADRLSAVLVVVAAVIGAATVLTAMGERSDTGGPVGAHPLFHVLLLGVVGAFLTGDIFNLYVWFEVMLIASFGLLVRGGRRKQLDGAVKYVALNLVSTVLFLVGVGLLYGLVGTLNMADLHLRVPQVDRPDLLAVVATLFLVAFGIKSALFPLFFWLPASYHTPGVAVSALFSGLLTKVGVYALIRTFTLVFNVETDLFRDILLVVAVATMIVGVVGAAAQVEIRRILSFHIVSQIGYMVLGLALMTPLAIAGAVFYLVHHIIVKANLFFVSGLIRRVGGSMALRRLGGLSRAHPGLALLFAIPALSLAGIPPLSGFWAKLIVVRASLEAGAVIAAVVALAVGLVTVFSMAKIWLGAFWSSPPDDAEQPPLSTREKWLLAAPVAVLGTLTVMVGLGAEPIFDASTAAAEALLEPSDYVAAVMGGGR